MSITGARGGEPMRAGIPIGDLGGGLFAAIGVLTALQARQTTGKGQDVDVSMLDGQISLLNYMATMYFLSGEIPESIGNDHFVHVPYGVFRTKTINVILACIWDGFYVALAELLKNPVLLKPEYKERAARMRDRHIIDGTIQEELLKWDGDELLLALEAKEVPSAPVNTFDRALSDAQVLARNMVIQTRHPNNTPIKMPGNPVKLSGTPCEVFEPPPLLGQHSREIYANLLGLSESEILELEAKGAI